MLFTGLCSITFRSLSIDAIIELAAKARLDGIEWGSDVHVPPGEIELAATVYNKTKAAGLQVCSYGSYYRCDAASGDFAPVLESAVALQAPVIRVWAGSKGSADSDEAYRQEVTEHLRRTVMAARAQSIEIALEYHGGTLTDTLASADQVLEAVGLPDLRLYWQPRTGGDLREDLVELEAALPHLSHVHCFNWGKQGWNERYPLALATDQWKLFIESIRKAKGERFIIFEFMKDDSPYQLLDDAQTLRELLHR